MEARRRLRGQGYLYGSLQLPYAASMERTGNAARKVEEALPATPGPSRKPCRARHYAGMSFQEKKAQEGVRPSVIFGMSFLFVFLILAALYESWTLPLSFLLGTPVAVPGAFAALWARGMENNIYAQIGLVMLIGLAAKSAILIVEFARARL